LRVLVTGANGFIGSFLSPALVEQGHKVTGLAMPGEDASGNEAIGVSTVRGDLTDPASIKGLCDKTDLVYHLAGRVSDWGPRRAFFSSIVDATRNLLAEAEGKVPRFVYISSVCAYGMGKHLKGLREDGRVFRSGVPYADAKQDAEKLCRECHSRGDTAVTIIRPSNVTGPGSVWVRDIVERFMNSAVPLFNHGKYSASLICVENLVDGLLLAGTMDVAAGQAYNFRDDWGVSWKRYLDDLGVICGKKTTVSVPFRLAWPLARVMETAMTPFGVRPVATRHTLGLMGRDLDIDNTKAKEELGWTTRVSYDEAMLNISRWVRESGLLSE